MLTRNFCVSLVLGLSAFGLGTDAWAGWGSWGGSYGSYGSAGSTGSYGSQGSWGGYASTGGSWGSSYGSAGGSWGGQSRYGLFARLHAKKLARRATRRAYYASYGGGHGSYGSRGGWGGSYGSHGSHGSWGGSYGSYGSYGGSTGGWANATVVNDCGGCDGCSGGVIQGDVIEESYDSDGASELDPVEADPSEARRRDRKGILTVSVPENARIEVNGIATKSTGRHRRYVSHGLKPGESYQYVVKAITERDGKDVEQTRVAMLRAGRVTVLDFSSDEAEAVETSLTLNVPEDAKVFLSGNETRATGEQRRFSTTRIDDGQKWADYRVRVTIQRDGRELSKEQRVTLYGGDHANLTFGFDQPDLVAAR